MAHMNAGIGSVLEVVGDILKLAGKAAVTWQAASSSTPLLAAFEVP